MKKSQYTESLSISNTFLLYLITYYLYNLTRQIVFVYWFFFWGNVSVKFKLWARNVFRSFMWTDSNNSTNKMQHFRQFIPWRLCVAQHVSGVSPPINITVGEERLERRSSRSSPTVKPEAASAVVCSWWWAGRQPKHVEPHINVK